MANKDKFYRDFSNRKPFNNVPCTVDEELVPVVLTDDVRITLKQAGLDWDNIESWRFPRAVELVPVVFVPNKKGNMDTWMKWFNSEAERYLKHNPDSETEVLSLDEFLDNINDEDGAGFDPTGTTENEDKALLLMTFNMLIDDLSELNANIGTIINLLAEGYQKKEILEKIDISKGKTQGYAFIEKAQKIAKDIYNKNYRQS